MKKLLIIFLVAVALLTMAQQCGKSASTGNTLPYKGGTSGLSIQFADGAPPDEVFDANTYPFEVEVRLLNVGEFDIPKSGVSLKISGINPEDFGKTQTDFIKNGIDEDVFATKIDSEGNVIDPSPVFVTFSGLAFQTTLPGNNQFPIRADVCYSYRTEAFADGCIRSDPLTTQKDAVCQVNEEKKVFNSGAPIQIAEFKELPSGSDKVRYVFKIQHKGSGRLFLPSSR